MSDELKGSNNGKFQFYEGGVIYWHPNGSPGGEAGIMYYTGGEGEILAKYREVGGPSYLGYPIADPICGAARGGCNQTFQYGVIYWSPNTGAQLSSFNDIRSAWGKTGYENGPFGYPVSDELSGPNGSRYQKYEYGVITRNADGTINSTLK